MFVVVIELFSKDIFKSLLRFFLHLNHKQQRHILTRNQIGLANDAAAKVSLNCGQHF